MLLKYLKKFILWFRQDITKKFLFLFQSKLLSRGRSILRMKFCQFMMSLKPTAEKILVKSPPDRWWKQMKR